MDKYVVYDEIGHGRHSAVFKARHLGQLQYLSLQRFEKHDRERGQRKYEMAAKIQHPNVLTVYSWCETLSQYWIVMDYCPGGALQSLLRQDGRLDETSIRILTMDIVLALQAVHAQGLIVCQLVPSKILVDNGRLILSDLSRAIDVSASEEETAAYLSSRDAQYMFDTHLRYFAPELFGRRDNVEDYDYNHDRDHIKPFTIASDLWALGCIMFEMLTGQHPFAADSPAECQAKIESGIMNTEHLDNGSPALVDLILRLLDMNPLRRCSWSELLEHPFWGDPIEAVPMPQVLAHFSTTFRPKSAVRFPENPVSASVHDMHDQSMWSQASDDLRGSQTQTFFPRQSAQRLPLPQQSLLGVTTTIATASSIRKSPWLAAEAATLSSASPLPLVPQPGVQPVNQSQQSQPSQSSQSSRQLPQYERSQGRPVSAELPQVQVSSASSTGGLGRDGREFLVVGREGTDATAPTPVYPEAKTHSPRITPRRKAVTKSHKLTQSIALDPKFTQVVDFLSSTSDLQPFEDLIFHQSDAFVSQIAGNPKIEKWPPVTFECDVKYLSFQGYLADQWNDLPFEIFNQHITNIQSCFEVRESSRGSARSSASLSRPTSRETTPTKVSERTKVHVLNYICGVAANNFVANTLVNSVVFPSLVRAIKSAESDVLKVRMARVASILIKEATLIAESVNMTEVLTVLADALRDNFRSPTVRRSITAAIGEALFYVASQNEIKPTWTIPTSVAPMIVKSLLTDDDSVSQQYAAKCIENVASLFGDSVARFATNEVVMALWTIFTKTAVPAFQTSCLLALSRLSYKHPSLLQTLCDKITPSVYFNVLSDANPRNRQAIVTSLLVVAADDRESNRLRTSICEDANIVTRLMDTVASSPVQLRAKYYLLLSQVVSAVDIRLFEASKAHMFTQLQKDIELAWHSFESDADFDYLLACSKHLFQHPLDKVPLMLQELVSGLEQIRSRKHPSPQQARFLKPRLQCFQVVWYAVDCNLMRSCLLDRLRDFFRLFETLPGIMDGSTNVDEIVDSSSLDFPRICFDVMELLCKHPRLMLIYEDVICEHVLPVCASLWATDDANSKLRATVIVSETMSTFSSLFELQNKMVSRSAAGQLSMSSSQILHVDVQILMQSFDLSLLVSIFTRLLENISHLFSEEPPLPALAASIVTIILHLNPSSLEPMQELGLLEVVIHSFHPINSTEELDNRQLVLLVREIVYACHVDVASLVSAGFVERLKGALLAASGHVDTVDDLIQPLLETVYATLKATADFVRRALQHKQASAEAAQAELLLQACTPLSECFDSFLSFLNNEEVPVALNAMRCLTLMLQLYSSEYGRLFTRESLALLTQALNSPFQFMQRLVLKLVHRGLTHLPESANTLARDQAFVTVLRKLARDKETDLEASTTTLDNNVDLSESLRVMANQSQSVSTPALAKEIASKCNVSV